MKAQQISSLPFVIWILLKRLIKLDVKRTTFTLFDNDIMFLYVFYSERQARTCLSFLRFARNYVTPLVPQHKLFHIFFSR